MFEFLLFLVPSVLYIIFQRKRIGVSQARTNVGWQWGNWQSVVLSIIFFPVLLGIGYAGIRVEASWV
ncbi:hypothetical protein [Corynebacterium sp. HMSC055A01]|uniref:hypothetical protein n=1 Tax=Corynebacterium sp. HMSC055A01 TaxID=1715083 RepID=UPI00114D3AEF|nr:hypothetical protein [Corynebacterium sp. HMSC055A01]